MALKAIDPITPFWWSPETPDQVPPPPETTQFHICGLTGIQYIDANSEMRFTEGRVITSAAGVRKVLKFCLLGWRNFRNSAGEVAFSDSNMEENIAQMPAQLLTQVVTRIFEASDLSLAAKKA